MRPLLIVDGDNLTHRAYHSTPKSVTLNAISGFFGMLSRICQEERPRGVFVAWDTLGIDTYRNRLWPPYQGGRVFESSIVHQLGLLPDVCRAFEFGVGKCAGYEADDLMAAAALTEAAAGGTALLLTTDKDSYQLVSSKITVLAPQRGTRVLDRIGPHQVVERFGVLPEQVPDFKALAGDSSDKIPGARGIGPQSAARLLLKHGSLESVLEGWPPKDAEQVLMFREVTRMRPDVQVELPVTPPNWKAGSDAVRAIGLEGLADRVAALKP